MRTEGMTFTAGMIFRMKVRGALDGMKMIGIIEDWREAKGMLTSTFYVKGLEQQAVQTIMAWRDP